ncbi:MAG: molybdopterin molybdotransferase MoeA [Betaproteobacteria bacterium]|jgi:molybdopterin molybdotransferase|nr:molybdopterin molybdotransferase MoeA [Betaproteobacteria bacterium]MDH4293344.1 molybdopterin molybdotransferase MoeA [Betaproteobacteria bacterium]MDH5343842.1 molybdopterin molybdotransferase MoeA [Betaproteobacteria bacterium]
MNTVSPTLQALSCADDYDPNSIPVPKAREVIARFLSPVSTMERVAVRAALGRVLAEDVVSPVDVPSHDNSAMDGYAVRFADLKQDGKVTLKVAGSSFAGVPFAGSVSAGQAVRIMTGGVVPEGADTIVMQEHAEAKDGQVSIGGGHRQGQNLRRAGEDLKQGQPALRRGQPVRPAEIGLIASLGIAEVSVYRKLRVAFFSTGDELVSVGLPLAAGQIYDSNRYTIYGMLTRLGCEVIDMGVIRDDPKLLEAAFREAASIADVVITSGGVSVGEADFVKELLNQLGEVVFWKIAMKPGRPLAYGKIGDAHFFGLPGNPVSVMVTFYQFVRDALLKLSGRDPIDPLPAFKVPCTSSLKKAPGRTEFQRGILTRDDAGNLSVRVTGEQGSGILRSMSEANCFIILPTDQGNVTPGTLVEVQAMESVI